MTGKLAAVIQMTSTANKVANMATCKRLIEMAKARGASMAFLPEGFDFIAETKEETLSMAETLDGQTITAYRGIARDNMIALSLGGFHCKSEIKGKTKNTHVIIDQHGNVTATYEKCHLFDVHIPEKGIKLNESDYVEPGKKCQDAVDTPVGKVGLAICYDLRFPELSANLRRRGAEILTFPSAFTVETGIAHWETLLKARAIENQCYVIAAAQIGRHNPKRTSFGHSIIIDPWGTVLAACPEKEGIAIAEIDHHRLVQIRQNMPVNQHHRADIFGAVSTGDFAVGGVGDGRKWPFGQVEIEDSCILMHTKHSFVAVNRKPVVPGHLLVIPRRTGVQRWGDLTPTEVSDLFVLAQQAQKVTEAQYAAPSGMIAIQDGKEAGQTIRQVHVHVLPRKSGDFKKNDDVYKELATHDRGSNVEWRSQEEMEKETCELAEKLRIMKL